MTDISFVYMVLGVAGVLLGLSIYCLYNGGINVISLMTMFVPAIISWKVSNLFIDGTLTRTLDDAGTVTEVVRELAMSQIFQLIGIVLFVGCLLQVYQFLHETRILGELEQGDE